MTPIPIHDSDDARVADYRQIRERDLTGRRGLFVAEGAVVLNVLASPQSRCRTVAIPMAGGFDSLNVAATSAVALHQMRFG